MLRPFFKNLFRDRSKYRNIIAVDSTKQVTSFSNGSQSVKWIGATEIKGVKRG